MNYHGLKSLNLLRRSKDKKEKKTKKNKSKDRKDEYEDSGLGKHDNRNDNSENQHEEGQIVEEISQRR